MAKLTLSDLASLTNETSAIATINANNNLIETALENTLSRDGTFPNSMESDLDMNGQAILNVGTIFVQGAPLTVAAVAGNGYLDFTEIAVPSAPAVNVARIFAYDVAGVTIMAYKDNAGNVREIFSPASTAASNLFNFQNFH